MFEVFQVQRRLCDKIKNVIKVDLNKWMSLIVAAYIKQAFTVVNFSIMQVSQLADMEINDLMSKICAKQNYIEYISYNKKPILSL